MILKKHKIIIFISLVLLSAFIFFNLMGKKEEFKSGILDHVDKFTYTWLSGNSKKYTVEIAEFKKDVLKAKTDKKDQRSYILGNTYLSVLNYNHSTLPTWKTMSAENSIYYKRISCIYSLFNLKERKFDISSFIRFGTELKDHDYLWIGNYYLLSGDIANAKKYYLTGLGKSKLLLKSFDIMMEISEMYQKTTIKKDFITVLPYIRPIDAFHYIKQRMKYFGYNFKIIDADDFDTDDVKKNFLKDLYPVFTPGDSAYLSMGDVYLMLYSHLVYQDKLDKLKNVKGNYRYLKKEYRKIVSYLITKKYITPYIDGKVHVDSPVNGFQMATLINIFIKKEGVSIISFSDAIKEVKKELSLDDFRLMNQSWRLFDVEKVKKYIDEEKFPVYRYRWSRTMTYGDLMMILYVSLYAKKKESGLAGENDEDRLKKEYKSYPEKYRTIVDYLYKKKIFHKESHGYIKIASNIHPIEFKKILKKFKEKL